MKVGFIRCQHQSGNCNRCTCFLAAIYISMHFVSQPLHSETELLTRWSIHTTYCTCCRAPNSFVGLVSQAIYKSSLDRRPSVMHSVRAICNCRALSYCGRQSILDARLSFCRFEEQRCIFVHLSAPLAVHITEDLSLVSESIWIVEMVAMIQKVVD